ncbi:MAG: alpha/beta hydrolase, partial [Flavisolibacter sp.]|nr:alpha/beta hydrolase [Flavisolibacter sp.]
MQKINFLIPALFISVISFGQEIETIYLNVKDSTTNMYIAVIPKNGQINSFMFLLDGFGNAPQDVLVQTDLPKYASQKGILTIIPILRTGSLYFGSDTASQQSLKDMINLVVNKYQLKGKDFYIGGFSIGGTCVVKYSELAVQKNYPVKPKAVFAVDPPLDWERFYNAAKRVVRLSSPDKVNGEVTYMIDRIKKEMAGTPETALENFYNNSPYSFSDTTQKAIKALIKIPIMIISEPDIQWWLTQRSYDYSYINITDQAAMINELQKLGNDKAVLVTTTNMGYRKPQNNRHPHSWSIADPEQTI